MTESSLAPPVISPLARVSPEAKIGRGCTIGDFTIIHGNVTLGEGSVVESHCILGHESIMEEGGRLVIGPKARIRSHSVFYEASTFGAGLVTGHRVTVREGVDAGLNMQIGTLGDLQGHSIIGDFVRLHSGVFLAQYANIHNFAWLFPHVVTTDDPHPPSDTRRGVTVGAYAAVGAHSTLLPGTTVGARALVAAHSLVSRDVPDDMLAKGVPAKPIGPTSQVMNLEDGRPAYPWTRHFKRGYPADVVAQWKD